MSSAVISPAQPELILKGLGKLWTSLGQEEKQQGKPTVLRACAMTLIVATDEPDEGFFASQTISELMREHPSRGVVLVVSKQSDEEPQARVLAQCWKPFGKAQQICCEQIEVKARPESWPKVGPILLGLVAADLPSVFWIRHQGALSSSATVEQMRGLESVIELSTKTIVDSIDADPALAFQRILQWRTQGHAIADLEWTRLTPWREPLSHVFDNAARENSFSKFHSIEISCAGDKITAGALYLAGWLSAPHKAKVKFKKVEGFGPGLHCVELRSDAETVTFERTGPECSKLRSTNGRERGYSYATPKIETLMTEELSIVGFDPSFDKAFSRAQELLHEQS
jgi:glucose-6-phosphate dehydrogenase assembly protein OpcA